MKQHILVSVTVMSLLPFFCWGDDVGFLVNIINKSPYSVAIQSTDRAGKLNKKDGNKYGGDGQPSIEMQKFNLADVFSFNFQIPWAGWNGRARIYIDVLRNYNDQNTLVNRYELMERYGNIELWKNNPGTYDETGQQKIASIQRNTPTQYTLLVDEIGEISIPPKDADGQLITTTKNSPLQVTFVFNGIDKPITIGSPNCSLERDLTKQFTTVNAGTQNAETTMLMKDNCKLYVSTTDDQGNTRNATACFGFVEKNAQGKRIPSSQKIATNFHETDCLDMDCTPDEDTGLSPCDRIGITWVEGLSPRTGGRLEYVGPNHYKAYYGIVKFKR